MLLSLATFHFLKTLNDIYTSRAQSRKCMFGQNEILVLK